MFHGDPGDDRCQRGDDVGGVQSAAHTGLPEDDIHIGIGKDAGSEGGGRLKIGDFHAFIRHTLDGREKTADILRHGDGCGFHAVDPETFPHIDQMGRGVETGLEPRTAEALFQQSTDRTFAVASGNMDELQFVLRLAETPEQFPGLVQAQFDAEKFQRGKKIQFLQHVTLRSMEDGGPVRLECPVGSAEELAAFSVPGIDDVQSAPVGNDHMAVVRRPGGPFACDGFSADGDIV